MDKEEALSLIKQHVHAKNLDKHMIAVGAIMKELAKELNENEEEWEVCGLLHDIDYDETKDNPEKHTIIGEKILKGKISDNLINAIKAHNYEYTNVTPKEKIDIALIAADAVSGLIIATALMMPNKKLEEVKLKSLIKKFKQKDFARGVNRNKIMLCEKLGINLEKFLELSLNALKNVSEELGL